MITLISAILCHGRRQGRCLVAGHRFSANYCNSKDCTSICAESISIDLRLIEPLLPLIFVMSRVLLDDIT